MRTLVTGGAGFIGSNLCQKLLEKGYQVVALDNLITSTGENLKPLIKNPRFTFTKHDLTKPLPKILNSQRSATRVIYHLACPTGVSNLKRLAEEMLLTCSLGTRNVLELAKSTGAKVLFTSSSEVYGNPQVFPQTEEYTGDVDPTGFRSPYEEGKRFAESLVIMYVNKYRIKAKIARVFNTYGPNMEPKDTRVIPTFLRLAKTGKPLPVTGSGLQTRTFCYIDDLLDGLLLIQEKGQGGEVYNIGSESEISILELAKLIIRLTGSKSRIRQTLRPSHDHDRRLPALEKVKKLGWRPQTNLTEGIKKILQCNGL